MTKELTPLNDSQIQAIKASIERRAHELEEAYMNVLIQAGPVSQCADTMKRSIDEILESMRADQFAMAASFEVEPIIRTTGGPSLDSACRSVSAPWAIDFPRCLIT